MRIIETCSEEKKNIWISLTGYRLLLLLKTLLDGDKTVGELISVLSENEVTKKSISKDTVRLAVSTLKKAGCEIIRPTKANDYHYQLKSQPFSLSFSPAEVNALLKLREVVCFQLDWKEIIALNELYQKIFSIVQNKEFSQMEKDLRPLSNINTELLKELSKTTEKRKRVQIQYLSPKFGLENIYIIPLKILYENGKFNLWCYNYKYQVNSMLNIERIIKILSIDIFEDYIEENTYDVVYSLSGLSVKNFELTDYEQIIEKDDNNLTIKAKVENEFIFIQRLLSFGSDFKIVTPDFLKEKLINKLRYMKNWYSDEEI